MRQVIQADVLGAAFAGGEDAQVPARAVDSLLIGAVGVGDGDLPVVLAVADQERHGDVVHHAVQLDPIGELDEGVEVVIAPNPQHVLPVVRHGPFPFAFEPAALDGAPVGVIFYALIVQLPYVLSGAGLKSTAVIGGISATMSLATAAGSGSFARLSRHTPRTLLPVAFGLAAIGLAAVFATRSVPVIIAGAVLTGFGTGLLLPSLLSWAVNRLDFEQRGRGTGLWTGTLFVGEFISPLIIAGLAASAGGLQPALVALAAVAAVLAIVTLLALPRHAQPLNVTHS